ncbi:tetratricopeptide repeat-containing serine protease family protein [Streptomyces sp. ME02-7008A-1]|uniref:tetratricopeptide repeat-containing serine protease family protein n=1 Tax=unclassified Streptomyces TaxID=2593676 RepID=UPI0029B4E5EE|nr:MULTISPECIES: tetratricopeptide repeat-containing serine protease family protein [unclassified Streptomyces]MDX3179678.1 tetratricopeptide repeat-containing serine protease family protein [Streptomyces sp. ME02-7008A-1]MDX3300419.1 tetratricopeptide repeat-containing serine protease family protein [Streptomyces sp. ME02-7008A]
MSIRSVERIAIVQGARQGSGFLLDSRLVLTSAHLFEGEGEIARVAVPGGTGTHICRLVWRRYDESCDAALLEADEELVREGTTCRMPDVRWGRVSDLAARENCEAIGFPQISLRDGLRPDTEQIVGTLKPGSSILRGRYVLDSSHAPPPAAGTTGASPWQGMSGAALFLDEYLIGVVSGDPAQWGHARVEAVPIFVVVADAGFRKAMEAAGLCPEVVEIGRPVPQVGNEAAVSREGDWVAVTDADPVSFGVHRAPVAIGHPDVVQYVPRCVDVEVDARLEALAETGGMLLLTGDSAAGKSRALFEGMVRNLGDWSVCKPDPDADLSSLHPSPGRDHEKVVWLDDLHNYLRSDGLTPSLLDQFVRRGIVVLATLRTEFHEHYTNEEDGTSLSRSTGPRLPSSPGRVIRAAHHITLDRIWTEDERSAASSGEDPRVVAALNADRAHGVAEYLAAGPQVLKRWKAASRAKGNPRGAALVAAAVALARTGVDTALPSESLARLHGYFLDRAGGPALRPESMEEAWDWASKIVLGVTSPLVPGQGGMWKPFDYLVSDTARLTRPSDLPGQVWDEALRIVDDSRRVLVATVAKVAGRPDVAKEVLCPLAERDVPDGLINLGALLAEEMDYAGAARCFERAFYLGDSGGAHNMGALSYTTGNLEAARDWYERAIESGERESIGALGLVHEKLGNQDEAAALWKRGTEAGDPGSALHYSDWLRSKWQSDEAVEALRVAADGEIPFAALSYAGALLRRKDHETANAYVARAYDAAVKQGSLGDPIGCLMAGVTAYSFGNVRLGEEWWSRAREHGHPSGWVVLEAADGSAGLPYLAFSQDCLGRLGHEEARSLMQLLWAGDCQDCGYPLGDGVPALYVDDQHWTDARLFHFGLCRYPHWNDSALISVSKEAGISWTAFTAGVPVAERNDLVVPALVINPSLEVAQLVRSGDRWTATAAFGPRSARAESLNLRPLWSGLPPRSSDGRAWALTGPGEVAVASFGQLWTAPATEEFIALVEQDGGMLLILASAVGPEAPATMEVLMDALESWDSMTRWVPLKSDTTGRASRTTARRPMVREAALRGQNP